MIVLDGKMHSELDWAEQIKQAEKLNEVVWKLDLGLFARLTHPLQHQMQFLSLKLSIDHFLDRIWTPFADKTTGLCLYEGDVFFEGHDRLEAADYLTLLAGSIPDELRVFIKLTADPGLSRAACARLFSNEPFERIEIVSEPDLFPRSASVAVYLQAEVDPKRLEEAVEVLDALKRPWRVIAESRLTLEWDGLDELLVIPEALTDSGKRMIQGFLAAGGEVREI